MGQLLHGSATTTEAVRRVIRRGKGPPEAEDRRPKSPICALFGCLLWREAGGGDADCGDDWSDTA